MADYVILPPEPFVVEGVNGTYELPRLRDLSAEQMALMGDMGKAEGMVEQVAAARQALLALCPGLEAEPLTDMGCMQLFTALAEGSGIALGES